MELAVMEIYSRHLLDSDDLQANNRGNSHGACICMNCV
jgi:hypothetical protein